jgi:hypothetical protein
MDRENACGIGRKRLSRSYSPRLLKGQLRPRRFPFSKIKGEEDPEIVSTLRADNLPIFPGNTDRGRLLILNYTRFQGTRSSPFICRLKYSRGNYYMMEYSTMVAHAIIQNIFIPPFATAANSGFRRVSGVLLV